MPNYNLEDFKTWLNEEKNLKFKKTPNIDWETIFENTDNDTWENYCRGIQERNPLLEQVQFDFVEIERMQREVIVSWMEECRERERERAK